MTDVIKVGDRVRRVGGNNGRLAKLGQEAYVVDVQGVGYVVEYIREDHLEDRASPRQEWWNGVYMEKVEQSPATEERVLPDDSDVRQQYPLWDGLFAYFPAALCEVARWSRVGNDKHNPGEELHWAREKSTDHPNRILRHLLDYDQEDENGFIEAVALAWRALALCQTELEKRGWSEGRNAKRENNNG